MLGRKTRILIVDDHPLYRESLAQFVARESDLEVCGQCGSAEEALRLIESLRPDLVTVDISLKDSSGLDLIKSAKARHEDVKIIALSMFDEGLYAERILQVGARGYVMKEEAVSGILAAIRRVMDGKVHLSEAMTERMMIKKAEGVPEDVPSIQTLSDRELEVFQFIGEGVASSQIAKQLHLSVKTVETYRANIKTKLHLKNNMELIRHAVQWVENGKTH
ncbi:MAG TPA: response regulator transcription factor [Verrucomicrobiae bacterium]|jgi:DNA-binding NarL/FixJ family response regulator|nr:response regulator transcription factor [Verrucomicrobiae bacterium]